METLNLVQKIIIWAVPVIFAITVHEFSHGWVASKLGDNTAKFLGRLTLNPIKHVDPIGTIAVPLILLVLGGFVFGWAKPVPINWSNLRNPKRDIALVAIAGPLSNLIMALLWALFIKLGIMLSHSISPSIALSMIYMGSAGILINLVLLFLNLIPIPPLDGSRVVSSFLPRKLANSYNMVEPYGFIILVLLLATGVLSHIIRVPIMTSYAFFINLIGL